MKDFETIFACASGGICRPWAYFIFHIQLSCLRATRSKICTLADRATCCTCCAQAIPSPTALKIDTSIHLSSNFQKYQKCFLTHTSHRLALVQSSVRGHVSKLLSPPNQATMGSGNVHGLLSHTIQNKQELRACVDNKKIHDWSCSHFVSVH
jgi:hypothetical protein